MTIAEWLIDTMIKLRGAGVDSPRRDALVLLEDTIKKDRTFVTSNPEFEIPKAKLVDVNNLIARRIKREPLAYIRGKAWFYGRFFNVTHDVMIPRPESESFIEILKHTMKDVAQGPTLSIVDVGTGSGCLAITVKLEIPETEVFAIDICNEALQIAKVNAEKHKININFLQGDLLEPLGNMEYGIWNMVLVANLPYVPEGLVTSPEISQEPPEALFSGEDGLDHYRKFFVQIPTLSQIAGDNEADSKIEYILVESLKSQHAEMIKLASQAGYRHKNTEILVQVFQKV